MLTFVAFVGFFMNGILFILVRKMKMENNSPKKRIRNDGPKKFELNRDSDDLYKSDEIGDQNSSIYDMQSSVVVGNDPGKHIFVEKVTLILYNVLIASLTARLCLI